MSCHYSCLTCSGTSNDCTSCEPTYNRTLDPITNSSCPCNTYYYDDLVSPQCQPCHYSCLTCTDSSTCATCDSSSLAYRVYDGNTDLCKCKDGYFDDNTGAQLCVKCHSSCLKCTNASACSDCDSTKLRLLNRTANYAGVANPYCSCTYKHYPQANPTLTCLPCHYTCG